MRVLLHYLLVLSDDSKKSLKYFIQRAQVLGLYRQMLKETRNIREKSVRFDVKQQIQREFRSELGGMSVSVLLTHGKRSLRQIEDMVAASSHQSNEEDSWISTKDKDDPRGRVGQGWPWNKL